MDSPKQLKHSPNHSSSAASSPRPRGIQTKIANEKQLPRAPSLESEVTTRKLQARSLMSPKLTPKKEKILAVKAPVAAPPSTLVAIKRAIGVQSLNFDDDDTPTAERYHGGGGDCTRLPLECLSQQEVKESLKNGRLNLGFDDEDDDEEKEEAEEQVSTVLGPDRARFNVWKGKNYDLHVLGEFKSDFEKKVMAFQRPETKLISMDPFSRSESGLEDEPVYGEAFVVWKNKANHWNYRSELEPKRLKKSKEQFCDPYHDQNNSCPGDITTSSDDSESDIDSCCSVTSVVEPSVKEYIAEQKQKKKAGLDLTGETLYYDEEFQFIRNLHRESHSLTSYGVLPDEKFIGKAHIFYPEMTQAEKNMLQPFEFKAPNDEKTRILTKAKGSKTVTSKTPRTSRKNDFFEDLKSQKVEIPPAKDSTGCRDFETI